MHRPPSKQANTRKSSLVKLRPPSHKNDASDRQNKYNKSFDVKNVYNNKERCQKCADSIHIEGSQCPAKKFQCKSCHVYGHFTCLCYQKQQASFKPRKPKAHMLQVRAVYAWDKYICSHSEDCSSSDESFCLQVKIQHSQAECKKIPTPPCLITNFTLQAKTPLDKKLVSQSKIGHLHKCQHHTK